MTLHNRTTTRRLAWFPAAIAVLGALSGAGCGSDDNAKATSTAEFTTAAEAACTTAGSKIDPIVGGIMGMGSAATDADRAKAAAELLAVVKTEIADLAAVRAPADKQAAYAEMVTSARTAAAALEKQGGGFWLDETDPFAETNTKAKALGLTACAGEPS